MGSSATDGMGRERASSQARLSASRNALSRARSSSALSKNTHPLAYPPGGGSVLGLGPASLLPMLPRPPRLGASSSLSCAVCPNGVSYSRNTAPSPPGAPNSWRLFHWGDGTPVRGNATMANGYPATATPNPAGQKSQRTARKGPHEYRPRKS